MRFLIKTDSYLKENILSGKIKQQSAIFRVPSAREQKTIGSLGFPQETSVFHTIFEL